MLQNIYGIAISTLSDLEAQQSKTCPVEMQHTGSMNRQRKCALKVDEAIVFDSPVNNIVTSSTCPCTFTACQLSPPFCSISAFPSACRFDRPSSINKKEIVEGPPGARGVHHWCGWESSLPRFQNWGFG